MNNFFPMKGRSGAPILCLLALALALTSCGRPPAEESAPPPNAAPRVRTATVEMDQFADQVEAMGTVRAAEAVDITSTLTETVTELHFEDGDQVKLGQLLATLEDDEEQATLHAAQAALAEQEREAERLRGLVKSGAVSEVRLEEYETSSEIARQKIAEVEAQLADRQIMAPFDGVLGFRRISEGALISPGEIITTLDVVDPVKLDFTVPETYLSDLKPGLELVAASDAWPGEGFKGVVTQIDTRVNPVTRAVTVRAEVPNPDMKLRPGMLMTTTIAKNPRDSLVVPERALMPVQNKHFVFVLDESGAAPVAVRTAVQIGRRKPGYVEILEGLEKGLKVVSDGLLGVSDGVEVNVIGEFEGPSAPYNPSEEA